MEQSRLVNASPNFRGSILSHVRSKIDKGSVALFSKDIIVVQLSKSCVFVQKSIVSLFNASLPLLSFSTDNTYHLPLGAAYLGLISPAGFAQHSHTRVLAAAYRP
jgi:hypothetical protein